MKNRPLVPRHRAFINLAYALPFDKWMLDFTAKWLGATRMPSRYDENSTGLYILEPESYTKPFFIFNTHITRKFRRVDVYAGVENIANFMQHHPIISAENPFGPNFDASLIYAPTDGRTIYGGLRIKI